MSSSEQDPLLATDGKATDDKGIPLKSAIPDQPSMAVIIIVMNTVPTIIGLIIAYYLVNDKVDQAIAVLASYDLGWLYLGIFLLKMSTIPQSILLGQARKDCRVNVPDQQVYKVMGTKGGSEQLGYVLMENEGDLGRFNRAQRALMNYHESFPTIALLYVAAGFVFPLASFVMILVLAVAKIVAAMDYVECEDRRNNAVLPALLALSVLHGMVGIAAYKAF